MDTPPSKLKSWSNLVARASQCQPPAVDVRFSIRAAILSESRRSLPAPVPLGFLEELSALLGLDWFLGTLAGVTLCAVGLGYFFFSIAPVLNFALSLSSTL